MASQHAGTMQDAEPEKRQLPQQPKPKPKLKLQFTLQPELRHKPKPNPMLTPVPAKQWEIAQPRMQSQKLPGGPGPTPMTGSNMAERRLIFRRDTSVPPHNKMDQEIASAINRALFHRQAPAHIWIMNARRIAKGTIMAITHQDVTAGMALRYRNIIITAAITVDKGVIDVKENESSERLKIYAVPLVQYMGNETEVVQMMRKVFEVANESITIPTQVRWLVNPCTIRERRQNGEINSSLVVFIVKGSMVAKGLVKKGIKAVGVWN